jgi:hypothetical protein
MKKISILLMIIFAFVFINQANAATSASEAGKYVRNPISTAFGSGYRLLWYSDIGAIYNCIQEEQMTTSSLKTWMGSSTTIVLNELMTSSNTAGKANLKNCSFSTPIKNRIVAGAKKGYMDACWSNYNKKLNDLNTAYVSSSKPFEAAKKIALDSCSNTKKTSYTALKALKLEAKIYKARAEVIEVTYNNCASVAYTAYWSSKTAPATDYSNAVDAYVAGTFATCSSTANGLSL